MKRLLIVVLICGSAVLVAGAQSGSQNVSKSGTTAATFLEIGVGAQAVGMGGVVRERCQ